MSQGIALCAPFKFTTYLLTYFGGNVGRMCWRCRMGPWVAGGDFL